MKNRTTFKETQKFNQPLLWVGLLGFLVFLLYGLYKQLYIGEPFGDKPMSDLGFLVTTIFYGLLVLLFLTMKLDTVVSMSGIQVRYFPFVRMEVKLEEIERMEVVNYGFVGWGLRYSFKYGKVFNVRGNRGLFILLKNGKKYCIGTQKEEELTSFISYLLVH